MKVNNTERWLRLALGAVVLFFAGIIYAWSILKTPFAEEFKWSAGLLGLNYTITICLFCLGGFASGILTKKISLKLRMIVSAVLLFFGFWITSRLTADGSNLLFISYGLLAGCGIGIVYNSVIGATSAWFPDKKGLCSGILMMAFGFSSLILGRIADALMKNETVGWRQTFFVLAIVLGVVLLIAAFLLKTPAQGTIFPSAKAVGKKQEKTFDRDYSAKEIVMRSSYWRLFLYLFLFSAVGSAAISFARDIITDVGGAADVAVTMVGVLAVFNGLGRLLCGALVDRLGIRRTQALTSIIAIAAPVVIVLALLTHSLPFGIVGLCLSGMSYGFSPTMSAAASSTYYGMKYFSLNFSLMNLTLIPSSFAATVAGQLKASTGAFTTTFIILAVVSVIGQISGLSVKKP
ncbi:MFS transporter [Bacteroidia bacterium]|nr:MFS transporter [Bacteroidia bacterium]